MTTDNLTTFPYNSLIINFLQNFSGCNYPTTFHIKMENNSQRASELALQAECFQWHWNTFPAERGLLHANNNNSQNAVKGSFNKATGVVSGVSDMEYCKGGRMLFIEMKTETGTQSLKQRDFQAQVEAEGFRYEIVRSFEQFKQLITDFRAGK